MSRNLTAQALSLITLIALISFAKTSYAEEHSKQKIACEFIPADSCQWQEAENKNLDGKDLSDSNYKAAHMHGSSFRKATLVQVNFQTADLSGANFADANLERTTFFAGNAAGANFSGANLKGVNFTRATLAKANLKGAQLDGMTLFIHTNLDGATWVDGRVCAAGSMGECK
jgi:uncharacterized protein YjbI with pentapeptide repeats